jgi:beta-lactam-binding protein with PASTA domain
MGLRSVTDQGAVEVVRCNNSPAKYVKIVFTGVSVPSLTDESLATATKRLQMIGLQVGSVTYRSPGATAGAAVVEQYPAPPATVPTGSSIHLVMS